MREQPVQEGEQGQALPGQEMAQVQPRLLRRHQKQGAGVVCHAPGISQQGTGMEQQGPVPVQLPLIFLRGQRPKGLKPNEFCGTLHRLHQALLKALRALLPLPPQGAEIGQVRPGGIRSGGYRLGQEPPFLQPGGQAGQGRRGEGQANVLGEAGFPGGQLMGVEQLMNQTGGQQIQVRFLLQVPDGQGAALPRDGGVAAKFRGGRGTSCPPRQASFSWYKAKDPEEKPGQMDGKSMRSSRLATS